MKSKCLTERYFLKCKCKRCKNLRLNMMDTFFNFAITKRVQEITSEVLKNDN